MLAKTLTNSRILRPAPATEMERRHALLRDHLRDIGADAAIALCPDDYLGGYTRWLTDRPAAYAYNAVAVFHAELPISIIEHGPVGVRRPVADHPEYSGTAEAITTTSWRSVHYTHHHEADIVRDLIRHHGYRRIALIGGGAMPHAFVEAVRDMAVEIVDVTDFVDRCKAIKSDFEITEIRATARMQDEVFATILEQIRPGMRDLDIMAIAQFEGRKRGSENGVYLVSSQPLGTPTFLSLPHYQGRRFERGDHVTVLVENNGAAGYYTELGRTIVLGKATPELLDAMDLAIDAQRNTLVRLKPGTACADIAAAHDTFMDTHKLQRETRLYAHSQGYDLVERPLIRADEPTSIDTGMNIVVHPGFVVGGAFGYVCDNFMVAAEGAPIPLHATEQKIFEV